MWALAIVLIICAVEAIKEYKAEKYAQKKVCNKDVNFFDFMLGNHPFLLIGGIILIICFVVVLFSK